jgi:signal transduction histidine kinase
LKGLAPEPAMLQNARVRIAPRPLALRAAMVFAVALVFTLAWLDLRREQARALDDFGAEQAALARVFAESVAARAGGVNRDLEHAAALVERGGGEPLLEGLIARDPVYRAVRVVRGGEVQLERSAAPAHGAEGWLRWFSAPAGDRTVLAQIDVQKLLEGTTATASNIPMRWLVLDGAEGSVHAASAGDGGRWRVSDAGTPAGARRLFEEMAHPAREALVIERDSAPTFGLERRMAMAGLAQARVGPRQTWSVAVVASARGLRDRARVGVWRLGAATGLAALLVGVFGAMISREQRRAHALAEALRVAEEKRSLERSLQRAEKLATIGTLAAGVAHEVGTPLGIISGRAEQLLARVPSDEAAEPMKKGLTSILAQVDKVSTTIRQLLDFARVRPIEAVAVAPAQLAASSSALLEHRFRQAKVALAVEVPASLPPVWGDGGQLEQVLVNLLMNAVDACAPGGRVTVSAAARDGRVVLDVADDGCGIAAEHLPLVLDPFFTTKKRGQGTGLGLTIAADIVKNHGGTLDLESAPGAGTRARVTLPTAKEAA